MSEETTEFLTAAQILAAVDLEAIPVDVPTWGKVRIRKLNGHRREELERLIAIFNSGQATKQSVRAFAAAWSLCDADGKLLFEPKQIDALAGKSATALDTLFDAILDFNGMTAKSAASIAKN